MTKEDAERFQGAMRWVRKYVYTARQQNQREKDFKNWWQFWRASPNLREAITSLKRVLVLARVSPHLIVSRQKSDICFDGQLMVVALDDDYHFGILQSRFHETWAWARGSTLEERLRYTNTTIFETYPFPRHAKGLYDPRTRPTGAKADRVATAADAFDKLRSATCKERGLGLTKIHNELKAGELPALGRAYDELNDAVTACYGFPAGAWRDDKETLRLLLELNQQIAEPVHVAR